jgi:putative heme-binding domain-containing protein
VWPRLLWTVLPLWAQSAHQAIPDLALGRRLFDSQCALCHGQGGAGGRGPSLNKPKLAKAADEEALSKAIRDGLPPEMPGAWQLSVREVASVAAYVKSLGKLPAENLPGNAGRGAIVYQSNACAGCHLINGEGTARGPELTQIGARRNAAHLRESLVAPGAHLPDGYLLVEILTATGQPLSGTRIAEDPFTIQIADSTGRFHSFRKSGLRTIRRLSGSSAMPSFAKTLNASDLDDLVAYLANLREN